MLQMQPSQTGTLDTFVSCAPQRRQSEGKIVEKSEPTSEAKRGRKAAATTFSIRVLSPVLLKTDLQSASIAEVSIQSIRLIGPALQRGNRTVNHLSYGRNALVMCHRGVLTCAVSIICEFLPMYVMRGSE